MVLGKLKNYMQNNETRRLENQFSFNSIYGAMLYAKLFDRFRSDK